MELKSCKSIIHTARKNQHYKPDELVLSSVEFSRDSNGYGNKFDAVSSSTRSYKVLLQSLIIVNPSLKLVGYVCLNKL